MRKYDNKSQGLGLLKPGLVSSIQTVRGETVGDYGLYKSEFRYFTGNAVSTSSLPDRIIIQKIAYLLKRKEITFAGYDKFIWYFHGVLCWELWNDTTAISTVPEKGLDSDTKERLDTFRQEFEACGLSGFLDSSEKLELITTILYRAKSQQDIDENNEQLLEEVGRSKDKFTDEEILDAISKVKQIGWKFD